MKINCAVAGLGRIGSSLEKDPLREKPCTHTGAIMANPSCRLIAGADIDPEARKLFKDDWARRSDFQLFEKAEDLLAAGTPDILVIATPPDSHRTIAEQAAAAGVPVIICEKPIAPNLKDARAIARLHRSGKTRILVNHERRYSADYQQVREDIHEERYGRLLSVYGILYFGRTGKHRDVLLHDGTHLVDIINFLTASHCVLKKSFGSMRSRRSSAYLFGKVDHIPVLIEVGAERDHLVFEIHLSFERGRIRIGNGILEYEMSGPSPFYDTYRSLRPDALIMDRKEDSGAKDEREDTSHAPSYIGRTGYFSNMMDDAVRCLQDPRYQPVSSVFDGLEVMRFIRSLRALL